MPTNNTNTGNDAAKKAFTNVKTLTVIPTETRKHYYETTDGKSRSSMDDNGTSQASYDKENNKTKKLTTEEAENILNLNSNAGKGLFHANGIFARDEIDLFHKRYRFGLRNNYQSLLNCKEYLFFTKPDLNIDLMDDKASGALTGELNPGLTGNLFWYDLINKQPEVVECLEYSMNKDDPFNHLLENMVNSNIDVPGLSADSVDTPSNIYGVGYTYRGSSEASDDTFDFSLEFKDTKYLPVYSFFKAYELYETAKHHGSVAPYKDYILNKVLHDQYSIYKFIVDEDFETIVYYAKYYGVKSKSLPRDVFNSTDYSAGLTYSIDFNAAFFEDMNPYILADFNNLSKNYYDNRKYQVDVHNTVFDRPDGRTAKAAYVVRVTDTNAPGLYSYKLRWRGDDKY